MSIFKRFGWLILFFALVGCGSSTVFGTPGDGGGGGTTSYGGASSDGGAGGDGGGFPDGGAGGSETLADGWSWVVEGTCSMLQVPFDEWECGACECNGCNSSILTPAPQLEQRGFCVVEEPSACMWHGNITECPSEFPVQSVLYGDVSDERSCGACFCTEGCAVPAGGAPEGDVVFSRPMTVCCAG